MITYVAINLTNKKFYVGSTVDFKERCKKHHRNKGDLAFHRSLRKDPENFYWIVSEDDGLEARGEEQYYLDFYHGTAWCYNLRPSAESGGDTCSDKSWWNKIGELRRSHESPGEGWALGKLSQEELFFRLGDGRNKQTAPFWNNGMEEKRSFESPGEGWIEGVLPGVRTGPKIPLEGGRNPNAKAIYLVHPDGREELFSNIREEAKKYNLQETHLAATARGGRAHHKKFVARYA